MKKLLSLLLAVIMIVSCTACGNTENKEINTEPQISQMRSICELAVMDCYYHNVAKYREENASGFLLWKKDKHFWVEYSGIVRLGIDVSQVNMEINENQVTITIPGAKVLDCKVDSSSLTPDSYIVDKNSADITAEDETQAFQDAQNKLKETASKDTTLLGEAQQRAQSLLEDYVNNIGNAIGKEYSITWKYLDGNGQQTGVSSSAGASSVEEPVASDGSTT